MTSGFFNPLKCVVIIERARLGLLGHTFYVTLPPGEEEMYEPRKLGKGFLTRLHNLCVVFGKKK